MQNRSFTLHAHFLCLSSKVNTKDCKFGILSIRKNVLQMEFKDQNYLTKFTLCITKHFIITSKKNNYLHFETNAFLKVLPTNE